MSTEPIEPNVNAASSISPQKRVANQISIARALQRLGDEESKVSLGLLLEAMAIARATPYEIEFHTRVDLVLTLGDIYVSRNELENARILLSEEAEFAEKIFQIMQASGTQDQKRAAAGGRVQIRDRARQVALVGEPAPEIAIKTWIKGEPTTLADLRGRVVLLEFWATWCKPCELMFPKLKQLDEQYREQGLDVIALTRHYLATRELASSYTEELELMRSAIIKQEIDFRVGVAEDESIQVSYGATGMPTLALIDRNGLVQYAHFGGGEDPRFYVRLTQCLNNKAVT